MSVKQAMKFLLSGIFLRLATAYSNTYNVVCVNAAVGCDGGLSLTNTLQSLKKKKNRPARVERTGRRILLRTWAG
jgi:hypothetical protein